MSNETWKEWQETFCFVFVLHFHCAPVSTWFCGSTSITSRPTSDPDAFVKAVSIWNCLLIIDHDSSLRVHVVHEACLGLNTFADLYRRPHYAVPSLIHAWHKRQIGINPEPRRTSRRFKSSYFSRHSCLKLLLSFILCLISMQTNI